MSRPPAETVRSMYAGFSELAGGADIAAYVRSHWDPECEYEPVEEIEAIRGHEALIAWNERWFEVMDEVRAEVDELAEQGDFLFAQITLRARGGTSGITVEQLIFHVFELRDGRILRMREYLDRDLALEAFDRP